MTQAQAVSSKGTATEISKAEWAEIQDKLSRYFASEKFIYSGRELSVQRVSVGEGKTNLAVYIDGSICVSWGWPSSDKYDAFVERVWRKRQRAHFSPARKTKIEKRLGKRKAREIFPSLDDVITWYDPLFPKASVLVRNLKTLDGIELVKG